MSRTLCCHPIAYRDRVRLACFRCGRVEEFGGRPLERLKSDIRRETGFDIRTLRCEAGGVCRDCAANISGSAADRGVPEISKESTE